MVWIRIGARFSNSLYPHLAKYLDPDPDSDNPNPKHWYNFRWERMSKVTLLDRPPIKELSNQMDKFFLKPTKLNSF